jgi:hypothetical protein
LHSKNLSTKITNSFAAINTKNNVKSENNHNSTVLNEYKIENENNISEA